MLLALMLIGAIPAVMAQAGSQKPELDVPGEILRNESPGAAEFWDSRFDAGEYAPGKTNPAKGEGIEFIPIAAYAEAASPDASQGLPQNIRNNKYFIESVRLTNLAQETYEYGDYDASVEYATEALKYAQLSDEYVALQLKIKEADDAIRTARTRIAWAASVDAANRYPGEYGEAQTLFTAANTARSGEKWDDAIWSAKRVIEVLALVTEAPPPEPAAEAPRLAAETPPEPAAETPPEPAAEIPALPAQYTVRPWNVSKDCFWNIAGRPWAYGDPTKWRLIYNANKAKLPQPDNPDLIHPGTVLDIPSINGEARQGMWSAARTYHPLR
jgi:hypothetical protein